MPAPNAPLHERTVRSGDLARRFLSDAAQRFTFDRAEHALGPGAPRETYRRRSVLLSAKAQMDTALALLALDGIARRLVLCLPDLAPEHLAWVRVAAEVDAELPGPPPAPSSQAPPFLPDATEWVLFTSGTTGRPKMVVHTLDSLAGPAVGQPPLGSQPHEAPVWSTFYDTRRYGGLQILLRALLGGGSMVFSDAEREGAAVADFLARAGKAGVTHISGTPSHWRRVLMSGHAGRIAPHYVRLSGEVADQTILDQLRATYPNAQVAHAFASTEAGVAFDVPDGLTGFPAEWVGDPARAAELRVVDGTLRIRSSRVAARMLGREDTAAPPLADADGFVDTGDLVELRDGRWRFAGRREGVINVGGQKVFPEEVEAAVNACPGVLMSRAAAKHSPITGAVVVAEVVPRDGEVPPGPAADALRAAVLEGCRRLLAPHKVPALVRFVPRLELTPAGKLARHGA